MSQFSHKADDPDQAQRAGSAMAKLENMMVQGRSFSGGERNCCFLNVPGERFATISAISGLDFPDDGRALALVDWDHDGDLDLWVSNRNAPRLRLMRNDLPRENHFLALQLCGDGKITNRDAIGARVEVVAPDVKGSRLIGTLRCGEGFLGQSSRWVHFGLGTLNQIDHVLVHWPGGDVEKFSGMAVDGRYRLVQHSGRAERLGASLRRTQLVPRTQIPEQNSDTGRIPLAIQLPVPRNSIFVDFSKTTQSIPRQGPTLVVLWASWCQPCRDELRELKQRAADIRAAGINVVALAVDGVGEDASTPAAAQRFCEHLQFPFPSGSAPQSVLDMLSIYRQMLLSLKRPLPVPSSFLIDARGRFSVMYTGRVSVDQLLRDARRQPGSLADRWRQAACLPGRLIADDGLLRSLYRQEADVRFAIGLWYARVNQQHAEAVDHIRTAVELEPKFAAAHQELGFLCDNLRRNDEALHHYKQAAQQWPDRPVLHYQIGVIYTRQQRFAEAEARFRQALKLQPDYAPAQRALAEVQNKNK